MLLQIFWLGSHLLETIVNLSCTKFIRHEQKRYGRSSAGGVTLAVQSFARLAEHGISKRNSARHDEITNRFDAWRRTSGSGIVGFAHSEPHH